ncbi:MAG TPA: 4-alpha-glucanotransferase, partial [Anaerolineae bacterium]|nr:4-alpha-glucanotransferase [Anaerolineae bacterium]
MKFPRASGILMHPTSLPGRFGIGDLGDEAYRFVDFLVSAGQTYWQVLPLSPTGYGDSPYQGLSAFAGNPMLISPERLATEGYLSPEDVEDVPDFPVECVDFGPVIRYKEELLDKAFNQFALYATKAQRAALARFEEEQSFWLDDVALFMAIKEAQGLRPWVDWPEDLARRRPESLDEVRRTLAYQIQSQKFRQWQFFQQWLAVKSYANERGIRIIGDIPIFVALDSADVWANPHLWQFDEDMVPVVVSGVPPDYFSETGQLWGHPLYRWDVMEERGYEWWVERFRTALTQADVVRIDHFRAFYNYWEVPGGAKTAVKGQWLYGPGAGFFRTVTAALGDVAIIAEDLGDFDKASRAGVDVLQKEFGYPGRKVLQFAFQTGPLDPFLPHNFRSPNWVAYTGTHDNDTILGWYRMTSTPDERDYARKYLNTDASDVVWDLIRLAWGSVANTAMTTTQDLLELGHESRMNTPSTLGPPNWCWRMKPGALTKEIAERLLTVTAIYARRRDEG